MTKQDKILKKINYTTGATTPVGTKPNDECYTGMDTIYSELINWAELGKLNGKNIICPCDWDIVEGSDIYSIKIEYLDELVNVTTNAVNTCKIQYNLWDEENTVETVVVEDGQVEEFLRNKLTCNFIRTLNQMARKYEIKSITASGYNPANGKGYRFQDVDYSKYDICITNPPFSLYAEFMNCVVDKIDFICLAPTLNRVNPNIGLPLMLKKCYLGFNAGIHIPFKNPTYNIDNKIVLCDWITSFDEAQKQRNAELKGRTTGIDYNLYKDDYFEMENMTMKDGTHPIRISAVTSIPDNYDGWMFASIGVLQYLSLDDIEWYGTSFKKYFNQTNPDATPFLHKTSDEMCIHAGKKMFHGIVFRRKINK